MKLKNWMSCFALAAFALGAASCSNDENEAIVDKTPKDLEIKVGINTAAESRAGIVGTSFNSTESLGLFLYTGDLTGKYNQVGGHKSENSKYSRYGSADGVKEGLWYANDIAQGIVLSDVVGNLYAYYPYATGNEANAAKIPVVLNATQGNGLSDGKTDATDQQIDYMWADKVAGVSNLTTTTTLNMNHAMAMLSFKFINGDYPGAGKITSIKVFNNTGKEFIKSGNATMNIKDGALTLAKEADKQNGVSVSFADGMVLGKPQGHIYNNNEIVKMLVFPTVATDPAGKGIFAQGDVRVEIVMDGKTYKFSLPAAKNLADESKSTDRYLAGRNYEYTFNLKGKVFGGDTGTGDETWKDDILVKIKDWITIESAGGDLESPEVNQ